MYNSIRPGEVWLDTSGKPIQAHGFSVFYNEREKLWYWYGENKEFTKRGGTTWTHGIRYYTSADLYNWEDRGLMIPPSGDLHDPLHPTYCMDRPHILYCKKTGKYVAWLKIMGGLVSQFMMILTADRLEGPYTTVRRVYHPLDMDSGDFTLCADEETGKAYIFFERPHFQLICATLTEDYTACTGEYSVHYDGLKPPYTREAPTFFTHGGRKYLFTSGTTGYFPNPSEVAVADSWHGPYTVLGDPCPSDNSQTTWHAQVSSVFKVPGKRDLYIALADRWLPEAMDIPYDSYRRAFEAAFDPEADPSDALKYPMPSVTYRTQIADYVWLPLRFEGDMAFIDWKDEWRVEDYD